MRFLRLDLIAFGPFTQTSLDFSGHGLHFIYGPNEAGKTSARHALRTALFGFRHRVEFDFLHDKAALRVGLTLEDSDGTQSSFIRRRGTKNDLLDIDDQTPLQHDPVAPLLARMGLAGDNRETHFERAFAIGEAELRQGGEEIIAGKGDLSELLFMTAAGLPRLRAVERELRSAADALFLPSGKKPPINEALQRWKDLQTDAQQKSLPPAEFLQHTEGLRQARSQREQLEAKLTELRRRYAHLERLQHAIHPAGRLREREQKLADVADAPLLPKDFSENRRRIETEQLQTANDLKRLDAEFQQLASKLEELDVPEDLLASAQEIRKLYKRLGSIEQAAADAPNLAGELAQFESTAKASLRDIRPDLEMTQAETLRLTQQDRATLQELADQRIERLAAHRQIEEQKLTWADEAAHATDELDRLGAEPLTTRLRAVCREIDRHRELESSLAETRAELDRLRREIATGCAGLAPWQGRVEDLEQLPVPSTATIERFETDFREIAHDAKRLAERRAEAERRTARRRTGTVDGCRKTETFPPRSRCTPPASGETNSGKTSASRFEGDEPIPLPPTEAEAIATRFESAIHAADDSADRLRREANRTQQLLNLSEEQERQSHAASQIASAEKALDARRQQLASEWSACWSFLPNNPRTPGEMRDWKARREELLTLVEQQRTIEVRAEQLAAQRGRFRDELCAALSEATGSDADEAASLDTLTRRAEQWLVNCDEEARRRDQARRNIERAQQEIAKIESRMAADKAETDRIERQWSERMTALGLSPATTAGVAKAFLAVTNSIFDQLDKAATLRERLAQMDRYRADFEADVGDVITRLAPDLAGIPAERAASKLNERLEEAQLHRDRRKALSDRREEIEAERDTLRRRSAEIDAELSILCRDAGCTTAAELPRVEERSERRRVLEEQIDEAKEELRTQSGGRSIESFVAEIDEIDVDSLGPELQRLDQEIGSLDSEVKHTLIHIDRHEQALSAMKGDAAAADALEDAEGVLAKLATDVERYIRLRLAARLLREGRERYRKKTGNEVLDRASQLFAELTCGAFDGLRVDFGESDEPTLFGIRSGAGAMVRPDGMSDGTADQLYLALRLAGLHAWLDKHEAVPFVVDDLLIHFDDRRAAAALCVLAQLAERTQVLFFTHHAHLRELALEAVPTAMLHLHDLTTFPAQHRINGQPASAASRTNDATTELPREKSLFS